MRSEIEGVHIRKCSLHSDDRGHLRELWRHDNLHEAHQPVMCYASWTHPGVTRGPHEHKYQADLFSFIGPGDFELHLWERRWPNPQAMLQKVEAGAELPKVDIFHEKYLVGLSNPVTVIVPPGVVHAYKCVSDIAGLVLNSPNVLYGGMGKMYEVDEIRHEDDTESLFKVD